MVCHSQAQAGSFSLARSRPYILCRGTVRLGRHWALDTKLLPHDNAGMAPLLSISYRRADSQHAAFGVYFELRKRLGSSSVFMDRSGISAGDVWPERLREAANRATVVLALIGPGWLTSADEYGRRRLDMSNDWVRNELLTAFSSSKPVIPVLLGNLPEMPPVKALPYELMSLSHYQAYRLTDDHWESDLNELVSKLVNTYEFKEAHRMVQLPSPPIGTRPLTQSELDAELKLLSGWELVENLIPSEYPKARQELTKVYEFRSLRAAINFDELSGCFPFNEAQHHPRWENVWKTLTVYFYHFGYRVSEPLDLIPIWQKCLIAFTTNLLDRRRSLLTHRERSGK